MIHDRGPIYALTTAGLSLLTDFGEPFAGRSGIESANDGFLHWLEINDLHLALLRAGVLAQWIPSTEICSQNDLTNFRYAKDYDAVVSVRWKGSEFRFAFEYERTAKTLSRYLGICDALESDMHLNVILYAASNYHLMCFLRDNLRSRNKTVCIGLMNELRDESLAARVMVAGTARPAAPFHDILMSCVGARNISTKALICRWPCYCRPFATCFAVFMHSMHSLQHIERETTCRLTTLPRHLRCRGPG